MTVRRLDGGTVKDEQDQQHTKAAFQRGGAVLKWSGQHGDKLPAIVHNFLVKISPGSSNADLRRSVQISIYLRLGFAVRQ